MRGYSGFLVGVLEVGLRTKVDFLRHGSGVQWVDRGRLSWQPRPPGQRGVIDAPFDLVIPCRVASQQSPTPFHRTQVTIER